MGKVNTENCVVNNEGTTYDQYFVVGDSYTD